VLLVEQSERFERRVGEATVELSGSFISRVLGLYDHLSRHHLPKHGLRYWFTDGPERRLSEMTEIGGRDLPHLPSFQLDRSKLDEHLLTRVAEEGCEVQRPAQVRHVEHGWPLSQVHVESDRGHQQISTRWVIDASGRRAFIARRKKLLQRVEEHPTAAIWARWKNVEDLDRPGVLKCATDPQSEPLLPLSRRLATNHFCGYGWWIWVIPLSGGETSIGLVYNKLLFQLPGEGQKRPRYESFLKSRPGLRELLSAAEVIDDDFMAYGHLPYKTSRYMDRGWALVGDAGAFLDPYYSPGLDYGSISAYATALIVARDLRAEQAHEPLESKILDAAIAEHNATFLRSYDRWLEALYLGKYELMGDAELVGCAFLVDTALYHLGVVTAVYKNPENLINPVFGPNNLGSKIASLFMRTFNRRLLKLARFRRKAGIYGKRNTGERIFVRAFGLGLSGGLGPLLRGLKMWARIEVDNLACRFLGPGWVKGVPTVTNPKVASSDH
jgi:flavin-dependent dehydrogenase